MKTRDICHWFLSKTDKSFVRNCIYENIIHFLTDHSLKLMNIERNVNISSSNFFMENDMVMLFEKVCDKNLCQDFMSEKSKYDNATTIFIIAHKVDKIASEKLTEDSYNWFLKSLTIKMVALLQTMTLFSDKEWDANLLGKPNDSKVATAEIILYSLLIFWGIKTFVKDVAN